VREIKRVIRQSLHASSRLDAVAWARFVADDCLCGTSTKAALQHEIATRGRSSNAEQCSAGCAAPFLTPERLSLELGSGVSTLPWHFFPSDRYSIMFWFSCFWEAHSMLF